MEKSERARRRRVAGRSGRRTPTSWVGEPMAPGELTVQLLPHYLRARTLPHVVVGGTLDVAPAIYAATSRSCAGDDRALIDEFGCVELRGDVVTAMLEPGACDCRVDVLDVAGELFPLNWAGTEARSGKVHVEGSLYLEPELDAGTPYGDAVALCRGRYRVRALRRYVRTSSAPVDPVALTATPSPAETIDAAVYVADLVAMAVLDDPVPVP